MSYIFDSSLPLRTTWLKAGEMLLVLVPLPLAYKLYAGANLTHITALDARAWLGGIIALFCLYLVDFYSPPVTIRRIQSVSRIVQATGLTLLLIVPLFHRGIPELNDPVPTLIAMILVAVCLATWRCLFAQAIQHPGFAEPAIIWGSGPLAANIIHELQRRPDIGIHVVGIVDHSFRDAALAGVRYLGSPEVIWSMKGSGHVRRLILALEERRGSLPIDRLMAAKITGLNVEDGTELYEAITGKVWLSTFSVTELLFSRRLRPSTANLLVKRTFSIIFAAVALIASLPIMLVTAILIRLDSAGPIIFRQTRVGENGRFFTLLKFRSMRVDATGCAPAIHDDPRCTRVGRWIRRFRIDELPQLINIFRGDMYLVGPRPFVPEEEASLVREIPCYRQRWVVRPGATGWAQVQRAYCASLEDNVEKLSYDLFYIKNLSIALDLLILLKTFKVLLLGRGGR